MKPSGQKPTKEPSTHAYSGPEKPPKVSVIIHPRSLASLSGASRENSRRRIEARTWLSACPSWAVASGERSFSEDQEPSNSRMPGTEVAPKSRWVGARSMSSAAVPIALLTCQVLESIWIGRRDLHVA